jgi:hypothetical protein
MIELKKRERGRKSLKEEVRFGIASSRECREERNGNGTDSPETARS